MTGKWHNLCLLGILIPVLFISGCRRESNDSNYHYSIPVDRGDGWAIASLMEVNIDEVSISDFLSLVKQGSYDKIHGFLVIRYGKLALEEYFPGYNYSGNYTVFDWNIRHYLASCTKSVTSALIGIAFDQGLLSDINTTLPRLFPAYAGNGLITGKESISLQHILTMSAGLYWDEWTYPYSDPRNSHRQMNNSPDPIAYVLGLDLIHEPGTVFTYNSGLSILLGGIIRNVSGSYADQYAVINLFSPLAISDVYWWRYANGTVQTGGGLWMRPRDMAKLGQLYLNQGTWEGTQVLSPDWVQASIVGRISAGQGVTYGYQWWLQTFTINNNRYDSYSARGMGGQYIYVFPDQELVVVFTGGDYQESPPAESILRTYVLPAVH